MHILHSSTAVTSPALAASPQCSPLVQHKAAGHLQGMCSRLSLSQLPCPVQNSLPEVPGSVVFQQQGPHPPSALRPGRACSGCSRAGHHQRLAAALATGCGHGWGWRRSAHQTSHCMTCPTCDIGVRTLNRAGDPPCLRQGRSSKWPMTQPCVLHQAACLTSRCSASLSGEWWALSAPPRSGNASLQGRMAGASVPCTCCVAAGTPLPLAHVRLTCSWRVSTSL